MNKKFGLLMLSMIVCSVFAFAFPGTLIDNYNGVFPGNITATNSFANVNYSYLQDVPSYVRNYSSDVTLANNTANSALSLATTANTTANNALPKSGGTMTGNLGIGNVAPSLKIDIIASNTTFDGLRIIQYENGTTIYPYIGMYKVNNTSPTYMNQTLGYLSFGGSDTGISTGAGIYAKASADWGTAGDSSDNPSDLFFCTVPDGSGICAVRMTIANYGYVGIGTLTPSHELSVVGNANITGTLYMGTTRLTGVATPTCDATNAGGIYYNATTFKHYGCNSTTWNAMY